MDTSLEAFASIAPVAQSLRERILASIEASFDGLTTDEIEQEGYRHQTASARVRELTQKGLIQDSGKLRATRSGRKAIVWEVVSP